MRGWFFVLYCLFLSCATAAGQELSMPESCWAPDTASALQDQTPSEGANGFLGLVVLASGDTLVYRLMSRDHVYLLGKLVPPTIYLSDDSTLVLRSYSPVCVSCTDCRSFQRAIEQWLSRSKIGKHFTWVSSGIKLRP